MTVIVTGAAGHVGANLVRALLAQGQPVRALVHQDRRALAGLEVELIRGDTGNLDSLLQAFNGVDTVYHLASYISIQNDDWPRLENININGTRNVIAACQACSVRRLIHFSSIEAFQKYPLEQELNEDRPLVAPSARRTYDLSKANSERLVRQAAALGLNAVILNPTAAIGPYDFKPSHIGQVLIALAHRKLPALVGGGFNWVDARDVAAGAIQAAASAPPGSRYILGGHWVSVRDLALAFGRRTGIPAPRLTVPLNIARISAALLVRLSTLAGKRPLYTRLSLDALNSPRRISYARASADFGYQSRPFEDTIADTLQWFFAAGQITLPRQAIAGLAV